MKTKRLILTAMLTGIALVIFIVEMQIPVPIKIPGIKLGLANIVTLFTLAALGRREALAVTLLRIVLGSIFTGGSSFIYSLFGGLCCYAVMCAAYKLLKKELIWAVSALGGAAHNIGQIAAARIVTGTSSVLAYLPPLIISGIVTGIFTGLCAYYVLKNRHIAGLTERLK